VPPMIFKSNMRLLFAVAGCLQRAERYRAPHFATVGSVTLRATKAIASAEPT
jgi:hypothetical protein